MISIPDGYDRHIKLKDSAVSFNVWYRPATRGERTWFGHLAKQLGQKAAEFHAFDYVHRHIVASDLPQRCGVFDWRSIKRLDEEHPELFETLLKAIQGLIPDSSGEIWSAIESAWAKNLYEGVILERTNPKLARRSCTDCQKWWYLANGEILINNVNRKREPLQGPTACRTEVGCPKGDPEHQKCLNKANRWALKHYLECQAVGHFPDDAIVRANAVIIRRALSAPLKKKVAA